MGRRMIAYASGPMFVSTEKRKPDGDELECYKYLLPVRHLFPKDKVSKPKSVNVFSLATNFLKITSTKKMTPIGLIFFQCPTGVAEYLLVKQDNGPGLSALLQKQEAVLGLDTS